VNPNFHLFKQQIEHPVKYRLFLLSKLPMAFMAGLKVKQFNETGSSVSVRFKWLNQNPFRSIYFAVISMAAELSTGLLAFAHIYKRNPSVSMLVVNMEASFYKKAVGSIVFTCNDGNAIEQAIEQTIASGEGVIIRCTSIGKNEEGDEVAKFIFTWSFKQKNKKAE
jgi:hypothetical protein